MKPRERRAKILSLLAETKEGRVGVTQLAERFGVSPETIRRDLGKLSDEGLLRKVHGGAVGFQTAQESSFSQRMRLNYAEKVAIGRAAAGLLQSGDSLFVDAGSTTILFAEQISSMRGLTVITNSVAVADRLWNGNGTNSIHLLGGSYDGEVQETLGPMVADQIRQFHADHAFLGIGAVSAQGLFTDFSLEEAHVARAMIHRAGQVTILVDSSKIGRTSLVEVCGLETVDRIVTDRRLSDDMTRLFEHAGVEVLVAGVGSVTA